MTDTTTDSAVEETTTEQTETIDTTTTEPAATEPETTAEPEAPAEETPPTPEEESAIEKAIKEAEEAEKLQGELMRSDYTKKTQRVAEIAKEVEAEKNRLAAEREALAKEREDWGKQKDAPANDNPFAWDPLPLQSADGYDEEADAAAISYINEENARIQAINKVGQTQADLVSVVSTMLGHLGRLEIDRAYERVRPQLESQYSGWELTRDKFVESVKDVFPDGDPFGYEYLAKLSSSQLCDIIKTKNSEELIKTLEDKVRDKPAKPAPKPPATVEDASVSGSTAEPEFNMSTPEGIKEYLEYMGAKQTKS